MKIATAMAVACLSVVGLAAGQDARAVARHYDLNIPKQSLNTALRDFARQTGLRIALFSDTIDGNAVVGPILGTQSAEDALKEMLTPSGLSYKVVREGTIAVLNPKDAPPAVSAPKEGWKKKSFFDRFRISQATSSSTSQAEGTAENAKVAAPSSEGDDGVKLEEIVVTAQKRKESTKDVPMSITALSGEKLQSARISNTLDLSFAVPGLAVVETGPGRQIIAIRGVGSERGSSSLTGVYLDEMPVSGGQDGFVASYIDLRTLDLERVEVLKGPQGTLFGEGAVGGVLRFITKDPELDRFGGSLNTSFYSTADGGGSGEVVGIANLPLVENVFGLRVAATYEDKAGWIDQPSVGRKDINDNEVSNIRVKGLWALSPQFTVKGTVVIHNNEGGGSNIVNTGSPEDSNFTQAFDRSASTDFEDEYKLYNLNVTYDFGSAELLSSTSRASMDSIQSLTQFLDGDPVPYLEILAGGYEKHAKITSQELRLTSSGSGPLEWTVGGLYKDAQVDRTFGPQGVAANLFGGAVSVTGILAGLTPVGKSESLAGFTDLSYAVTPRLKAGGGLRYFYDKRESYESTNVAATFLKGNFDALTFRAYVSYAAMEGVNVYVNVGDGFRSGGFNSPSDIPRGAPATYDPESVLSYEAGIKTLLYDGRIGFDAALFYSKYQDMQEDNLQISPVDGFSLQFTANNQNARLKGAEWDFSWKATQSFTLGFSGEVIDTEITQAASASPFLVGDPINFIPKYSLAATASYEFDWAASTPGFFRTEFSRHGKSFGTARGGVGLMQGIAPEVSFVNASLGLEHKGWEVALFGRNLTDERGIIHAGATGANAQARPRTVGVTIGKRF